MAYKNGIIHLLYQFDLKDPVLDFALKEQEVLPLYFPICYDDGEIAYRLEKNGGINILKTPDGGCSDTFPYENYPKEFPKINVRLQTLSYREYKTLSFAISETDMFTDLDPLSPEDKSLLASLEYPFALLGDIKNLPFDVPPVNCPNINCHYHDLTGSMDLIAFVPSNPVPGISLWGDYGDYVYIYYYMCSECKTIFAGNICD